MWRIQYETLNFLFEAYGDTKQAAALALIAGWETHARQHGLPPLTRNREDMVQSLLASQDFVGTQKNPVGDVLSWGRLESGVVFREGTPLTIDPQPDAGEQEGEDPR